MFYKLIKYQLTFLLLFTTGVSFAQQIVTGTVYDSSKSIPVKNVLVRTNSGDSAITDSAGRYTITLSAQDSLFFIYKKKPTAKFSVKQVPASGVFDIALHVHVDDKVKTLKEVRVFGRNYKQDSIENRITYAHIFNYSKPGFATSTPEYGGAAGMDLDEFINIFRFKRNRRLQKFQDRLIEQEEESFIDYRFNKRLITRITKLEGDDIDDFMRIYRPDFQFAQNSSTVDFYQYILNASYEYKRKKLERSRVLNEDKTTTP